MNMQLTPVYLALAALLLARRGKQTQLPRQAGPSRGDSRKRRGNPPASAVTQQPGRAASAWPRRRDGKRPSTWRERRAPAGPGRQGAPSLRQPHRLSPRVSSSSRTPWHVPQEPLPTRVPLPCQVTPGPRALGEKWGPEGQGQPSPVPVGLNSYLAFSLGNISPALLSNQLLRRHNSQGALPSSSAGKRSYIASAQ